MTNMHLVIERGRLHKSRDSISPDYHHAIKQVLTQKMSRSNYVAYMTGNMQISHIQYMNCIHLVVLL